MDMDIRLSLSRLSRNIWFTSDTHYAHKNICRGVSEWTNKNGTRDFSDLSKMNDILVKNINDVVAPDDILFHLGDWSFGGIENVRNFRDRIVCQNVHLILGNHDHHIKRNTDSLQDLFLSVSKIANLEIKIDHSPKMVADSRFKFVLSHYPIASWEDMNRGVIHLHGHVHLTPQHRLHEGKSMDVGCDGNGLKPINARDIISIMNRQPIAKTTLLKDHHEEGDN